MAAVPQNSKAYIVTGPTSGIGRATAFELAKHGTVVLVGRDRKKLDEVQKIIEQKGRHAVSVVCDLSDIASVRDAAKEIANLGLSIAGLINNAGIMQTRAATKNGRGWDMTFATNHLGPFALTETLMPHLADGANILFVVSAVEDPERKPAVAAGFRGGRYISGDASAQGKWKSGGSQKPGFDAYATSKQAILAAALRFAHEAPRLHINAVEPGFNPTTGLGNAAGFVRLLQKFVFPLLVPLLTPFIEILSTPKQAASILTKIITDESGKTGMYYNEKGRPMQGSPQVHDPKFQERVVTETRSLLANIST